MTIPGSNMTIIGSSITNIRARVTGNVRVANIMAIDKLSLFVSDYSVLTSLTWSSHNVHEPLTAKLYATIKGFWSPFM